MATASERVLENVSGEFFVDNSCIDCDACRQIAPNVFRQAQNTSFVYQQPTKSEEQTRALMALVACPTNSIGTVSNLDARHAARQFPELIENDIYYCGYTSKSSFGAASYLIKRPTGNILVDSPRAAGPLRKKIQDLGGVKYMFLTHRDDVADHKKFAQHFGCERFLHQDDVSYKTQDVEHKFTGNEEISIDKETLIIPTPGHTKGSTVLLYQNKYLFSGDHLWQSSVTGKLHASKRVCWYSWPEQIRSIEKLLGYQFSWVLPGHGRRYQTRSPKIMHQELLHFIKQYA